jgi:hypothetical protein
MPQELVPSKAVWNQSSKCGTPGWVLVVYRANQEKMV